MNLKQRLLGLGLVLCGLSLIWLALVPSAFAQDDDDAEAPSDADASVQEESEEAAEGEPYVPSGDNSYCLVCHSNVGEAAPPVAWSELSIRTAPHDLASVVHHSHAGREAIGCLDCHESSVFPHLGERVLDLDEWAFAENYTDACVACHQQQAEPVEAGCYSCHQDYEIERDAAVLEVGLAECQSCHASTINEWEMSAHGDQQLACDSCHYPHQDELRFGTVNALCLNCHDQSRDNYTHVLHTEQSCADCHVYQDTVNTVHIMTGGNYLNSGHDNLVTVGACIDCHEAGALEVAAIDPSTGEAEAEALPAEHPLVQAQEEIERLEAEIETTRVSGGEEASVFLVQSLVIGLALGIIGMTFFARSRIYLNKATDDDTEDETA